MLKLSSIEMWHPAVFLKSNGNYISEFIYIPRKSSFFAKQESAILVWGRLRRPQDAWGSQDQEARKPGVSRGLLPGGLRCPGTQSVCLRQNRGSNRPEKWLNRFLVQNSWGLCGASWGLLRLPEADLNLIPGFNTDSVFPPILPFSFTDCPRLRVTDRIGT